ncbi:MAG: hypothetical protein KatS3mg085_620 [Candidatus Dojkabacteria bacterium]|nr:MAG: hypothetical protein KatS3mg085_620 [Candidatus Dojkabacteria bacterium]
MKLNNGESRSKKKLADDLVLRLRVFHIVRVHHTTHKRHEASSAAGPNLGAILSIIPYTHFSVNNISRFLGCEYKDS